MRWQFGRFWPPKPAGQMSSSSRTSGLHGTAFWHERGRARAPALLLVPPAVGNQPHLSLSNETVSPLALVLKCAVSWALIVEPSEPLRCTVKVECSTPLCLLSASPNQVVKWPVNDGLLRSSGTAATVPVIVPVAQKS